MKRILTICFIAFGVFVFFISCQAHCEMREKAVVYLRVLDENGNALKDTYEKNLIVRHSDRDGYWRTSDDKNPKIVLNREDDLIFELGDVSLTYNDCTRLRNRDAFTDEEVREALNGAGIFTIKDKNNIYKTVANAMYSDYLVSVENLHSQDGFSIVRPAYIYHCEIKLKKKQ